MALASNDNNIYYHMDVQWSNRLLQTYFANPDSLDVQCWIHATFLSPDTVNQTEAHVYHYTKVFSMWLAKHLWASHVLDLWL